MLHRSIHRYPPLLATFVLAIGLSLWACDSAQPAVEGATSSAVEGPAASAAYPLVGDDVDGIECVETFTAFFSSGTFYITYLGLPDQQGPAEIVRTYTRGRTSYADVKGNYVGNFRIHFNNGSTTYYLDREVVSDIYCA